jgi:hypothetical protein
MISSFFALSMALVPTLLNPGTHVIPDTLISFVLVNGGADTVNPGVTCVQVASEVSAACPYGMIAIPNSNKGLVAAAMQAKATGSKVELYYNETGGPFHCAQVAFTPCSVVSIGLR